MKFVELNEKEYQAFASHHCYASFQQTPMMKQAKQYANIEGIYLGVKENEEVIAASLFVITPVFKKYVYYYASRGLLMDYSNLKLLTFFIQNLKKYCHDHRGLYVRIDPNVELNERDINGNLIENGYNNQAIVKTLTQCGLKYCGANIGFDARRQMRFMFVLDLENKTEEQLLKEMDQQTRWSVNKTLKMGVEVKEITDFEVFKKVMTHTSERRGFEDREDAFYLGMKDAYGDSFKMLSAVINTHQYEELMRQDLEVQTKELAEVDEMLSQQPQSKKFNRKRKVVLEAIDIAHKRIAEANQLKQYGDECVLAVATFICVGKEVVYFTSGAYDHLMKYNGPYAIQWHMLRYALENHYTRYNFYGCSGDFRKEAEDYGVYEFKKGFNGKVIELVGDFILEVNPAFKIYNAIKKIC